MDLTIYLALIVICFFALTRICDRHFIPSLDFIAKKIKMSHDAAGATLMAVGSSAAELFIAIIALIKPGDHAGIGIGTIVGSAIFNILAIVGAAAIVRRVDLNWKNISRDLFFYALSILLLFHIFSDGVVELVETFYFLALYLVYVLVVVYWQKIVNEYLEEESFEVEVKEGIEDLKEKAHNFFQKIYYKFCPQKNYYLTFFVSIIAIALLSWLLVESAVKISEILQVPDLLIGLTILAIGSSIPDMISSIIVSKQGRGGMAVSNAIGSNIFDILFSLGFPWLMFIAINSESVIVDNQNLEKSVVLLFASIFIVLGCSILSRWRLGKLSGVVLLILYIAYLLWIINFHFPFI